jgi:hypothetical protein
LTGGDLFIENLYACKVNGAPWPGVENAVEGLRETLGWGGDVGFFTEEKESDLSESELWLDEPETEGILWNWERGTLGKVKEPLDLGRD